MKIQTPTSLMLISLLGMLVSLGFGMYLFLSNYYHVSNAKFSPLLSEKSLKTESDFHADHDFHLSIMSVMCSAKIWDFIVDALIMLSGVLPWMWRRLVSTKFFRSHPTLNYYAQAALMLVVCIMLRVILSIPWILIMNIFMGFHFYVESISMMGTLIKIVGLFIAMGIYGKTGKAFPIIVAAVIAVGYHIFVMIAGACYHCQLHTLRFQHSAWENDQATF